ncbi:hypothetical protein OZ411_43275 [Bradyrhizobium sp. Arg237L]|uniref:hypothetical protein n=1 Tax=Bradyrhizobium sp. Arg237L TaxID=3003352 RepID=UPI00249EA674|nr:hypothetical protein [Bradyrhizobium sp. Arg237L]MDI4239606.1 hypothetical protein [Bradyrhizobium sp. Arg237L]
MDLSEGSNSIAHICRMREQVFSKGAASKSHRLPLDGASRKDPGANSCYSLAASDIEERAGDERGLGAG